MDTAQTPDIFTRLGMASASDEQKQKLAEQLADLTMTRVLDKISSTASADKMAQVERLVDSGDPDGAEAQLRELVPDYDELVQTTAREAADQIVADQQAVLAQVRKDASTV